MDGILSWLPNGNEMPYTETVSVVNADKKPVAVDVTIDPIKVSDTYMEPKKPFGNILIWVGAIIIAVLIFKK